MRHLLIRLGELVRGVGLVLHHPVREAGEAGGEVSVGHALLLLALLLLLHAHGELRLLPRRRRVLLLPQLGVEGEVLSKVPSTRLKRKRREGEEG